MMNRKRLMSFWLVAALICSLSLPAFAAKGDAVFNFEGSEKVNGRIDSSINTMVGLEDTLYLLTNGARVYRWTPGDAKPQIFVELPQAGDWQNSLHYADATPEQQHELAEQADAIAAGDGKLWAFNWGAGRFGTLDAYGLHWSDIALDISNTTYFESERHYSRHFRCLSVRDGQLYALRSCESESNWTSELALIRFDLATGAQTELKLPHALDEVAQYKPGQLIGYSRPFDGEDEKARKLWQIDQVTGAASELSLAIPEKADAPYGFTYDSTNDCIVFVGSGVIYRSIAGSPFEVAGYVNTRWGNNDEAAALLTSGVYAVVNGGVAYTRDVNPNTPMASTLHIVGGYADDMFAAYTTANPTQAVHFFYDLTGTEPFDLAVADTNSILRARFDKGYAADLSGISSLKEPISAMYPAIQAALSDSQGRLMAVPLTFGWLAWWVDIDRWNELELGPLPTTFDEFLDLVVLWEDSYAEDHSDLTLYRFQGKAELLELVLSQYILQYEQQDQPLDFDTPTLRRLLSKIANLPYTTYDPEHMTEAEIQAEDARKNGTALIDMYSNTLFASNKSYDTRFICIAPMAFEPGELAKIKGWMQVISLAPNAASPDLAREYLDFAISHLPDDVRYALNPNLNDPLRYPNFDAEVAATRKQLAESKAALATVAPDQKQSLQENIDWNDEWLSHLDQNQWQIAQSSIDAYRQLAPQIVVTTDSIFGYGPSGATLTDQLGDLQQRYAAGQLDLDSFLRELTNKARMMFLEGK